MTTETYRTTDLTKWGTGKGSNLTAAESDNNFWADRVRLAAVEAAVSTIHAGIDHFTVSGTSFNVVLTDSTVLGPYTLPTTQFRFRGAWAAGTIYAVYDIFTINGGLYEVIFAHTSASTFSAGANDGHGHDYYALWIQTPGSSLPSGGAAGMRLKKSSATDYAVAWDWLFPTGGTTGKFLRQKSSTQDDVEWAAPKGTEVSFTATTSGITATTVSAAIEEVATGVSVDAVDVTFTPSTASGLSSGNVEDAINEVAVNSAAGKQTMWIPALALSPLITNGAATGAVEMSSTKNIINTLDFDKDTVESAQFEVAMPKSWGGGTLSFKAFWSHGSTTTNFGVVWKIGGVIIPNSGSLDATYTHSATVTDTGGIANFVYVSNEADSLLLDGTGGDDNYVIFRVSRLATDSNDTLAVDARLHGIQLFYTTDAGTDN